MNKAMNRSMNTSTLVTVLRFGALGFMIVAPLFLNAYWLFLTLQVAVFSYLAFSVDIAYSYSRLLSFCQGLFFAAGAYTATYFASSAGWSLPVMLLCGTLAGTLLGAVLGLMLMRMHTHGAVIATVIIAAASFLIANAMSAYTGGDDGLSPQTNMIGIAGGRIATGLKSCDILSRDPSDRGSGLRVVADAGYPGLDRDPRGSAKRRACPPAWL